jgi:serine/threonine protein kinase
LDDYVYDSAEGKCKTCSDSWTFAAVVFALALVLVSLAAALYVGLLELPAWLTKSPIAGTIRQMDSGTFRISWSSYQIVQSVTWSLDIRLPEPFASVESLLSIVSFDFLSPDCFFNKSSEFNSVYLWSLVPLVLAVANWIVFYLRGVASAARGCDSDALRTRRLEQHVYYFLMGGYLLLPTVARSELQALDCVQLRKNEKYLRVDTSVSCMSASYQAFVMVDVLFICVFLSIPILWFVLLWSRRNLLNPKEEKGAKSSADVLRSRQRDDSSLAPYFFLFSAYRPPYYYFECVEIYRRILFIGVLPLLSTASSRRAAFGVFFSLCSAVFYREINPFINGANNLLVFVAQYAILVTFAAALAIETDLSKNVDDTVLGCILVLVNGIIMAFALVMSWHRHRYSQITLEASWHVLTEREAGIVAGIMGPVGNALDQDTEDQEMPDHAGSGSPRSKEWRHTQKVLRQFMLRPRDVTTQGHLGGGAFGDVFKGSCLGTQVAVKVPRAVSVASVKAFRAEILLTASLRHPNIVSFVGACWSGGRLCLVLELVPGGSLGDLLAADAAGPGLLWEEPLLRLAQDVARGMAYLHARSYFDEVDGCMKECIVHRDLKPDNVLITGYSSAKVSDFGTSKAKEVGVTMTITGTPLFVAPEVLRGQRYTESVDVYSFGVLLVCLAVCGGDLGAIIALRCREQEKPPGGELKTLSGMVAAFVAGDLTGAPRAITSLVTRCCGDPATRPSFQDVLHELTVGPCAKEVEAGVPFKALAFDDKGRSESSEAWQRSSSMASDTSTATGASLDLPGAAAQPRMALLGGQWTTSAHAGDLRSPLLQEAAADDTDAA